MAAYGLFDILQVNDRAALEEYRKRVQRVVEQFSGRYLVVGGQCEVVEGDWRPVFPVIIQFPSLAQARRWYDSEDYRPLKQMRLQAARSNAVFIEGL